MDNIEFVKAINAYKVGNFQPLEKLVSSTKKVDGYEWYSIRELLHEQKAFNLPIGSHYIPGTLHIFHQALDKSNKKDGRLEINDRLGTLVLAEDPEIFDKFLNLYVGKAITETSYTLSSELLAIYTAKKESFWRNFFDNYLDFIDFDKLNDQQLYNVSVNTNKIFDADITQHKLIGHAIEFDSEYPKGQVLQQILTYVIDFDKYIVPRTNINRFGRTADTLELCKKFANVLQKIELEMELNNELSTKDNKDKPKPKL